MAFSLFSDPPQFYEQMLKDIAHAKKSIYLETYIYDADEVGKKFLTALTQKAAEGVEVKVLIDAFGSSAKKEFFQPLRERGGQIRFFKEMRYVLRIIAKNHERNHRKLLIIDDTTAYLGSANITRTGLSWRELVIRIQTSIVHHFTQSFKKQWKSHAHPLKRRLKTILHEGFEIIQDVPSLKFRTTEQRYKKLIEHAQKEICIEVPYFVPSYAIRRALAGAVKRNVTVKLLVPYRSDVQLLDIIRNRYFGRLHRQGVHIFYYKPKILHSKLMILDDKIFILGSSNLDYRSFLHQYEINLLGRDIKIIRALKKFFNTGLQNAVPFNYAQWKNRSSFAKIPEFLLSLIRRYL